MSVTIAKFNLFYASIPKIACTSLKMYFFKLENGHDFSSFKANGKRVDIHRIYKPKPMNEILQKNISKFDKIAFVRDPVERFLSAYSNRVIFHGDMENKLSTKELSNLELPTKPDIHTFIQNYEIYAKISRPIFHHTKAISYFLGNDPTIYERLYKLSEIEIFENDIEKRTNQRIKVPHLQTGGPKVQKCELTAAEVSKIKSLYEEDYNNFGSYF